MLKVLLMKPVSLCGCQFRQLAGIYQMVNSVNDPDRNTKRGETIGAQLDLKDLGKKSRTDCRPCRNINAQQVEEFVEARDGFHSNLEVS